MTNCEADHLDKTNSILRRSHRITSVKLGSISNLACSDPKKRKVEQCDVVSSLEASHFSKVFSAFGGTPTNTTSVPTAIDYGTQDGQTSFFISGDNDETALCCDDDCRNCVCNGVSPSINSLNYMSMDKGKKGKCLISNKSSNIKLFRRVAENTTSAPFIWDKTFCVIPGSGSISPVRGAFLDYLEDKVKYKYKFKCKSRNGVENGGLLPPPIYAGYPVMTDLGPTLDKRLTDSVAQWFNNYRIHHCMNSLLENNPRKKKVDNHALSVPSALRKFFEVSNSNSGVPTSTLALSFVLMLSSPIYNTSHCMLPSMPSPYQLAIPSVWPNHCCLDCILPGFHARSAWILPPIFLARHGRLSRKLGFFKLLPSDLANVDFSQNDLVKVQTTRLLVTHMITEDNDDNSFLAFDDKVASIKLNLNVNRKGSSGIGDKPLVVPCFPECIDSYLLKAEEPNIGNFEFHDNEKHWFLIPRYRCSLSKNHLSPTIKDSLVITKPCYLLLWRYEIRPSVVANSKPWVKVICHLVQVKWFGSAYQRSVLWDVEPHKAALCDQLSKVRSRKEARKFAWLLSASLEVLMRELLDWRNSDSSARCLDFLSVLNSGPFQGFPSAPINENMQIICPKIRKVLNFQDFSSVSVFKK